MLPRYNLILSPVGGKRGSLDVKGRAEEAVRAIFPETTIVRPSPLFGHEDNLLNKLAGTTNILTSNHMNEKYYPVHVSLTPGDYVRSSYLYSI